MNSECGGAIMTNYGLCQVYALVDTFISMFIHTQGLFFWSTNQYTRFTQKKKNGEEGVCEKHNAKEEPLYTETTKVKEYGERGWGKERGEWKLQTHWTSILCDKHKSGCYQRVKCKFVGR